MIAGIKSTVATRIAARLLPAMVCACLLAGDGRADELNSLQPDTVWKGEIDQGNGSFPTTIYIQHREKDRIKGEIDFQTTNGLNKLAFQGNVIGGDTVVWITDKLAGNVTYPGLYIGKIDGNRISGTWQVPSVGQYDQFSVSLVQ